MNYFKECKTVAEVKKTFRKLAMTNHPDKGGDTVAMQHINNQYTMALKSFDGTTDGEYQYKYNETIEKNLMDKLFTIMKISNKIEIELIGTWLWIKGDTKTVKAELKKAGCKWHSKRICWYYTNSKKRYFKHSNKNLEQLGEKYGSKMFQQNFSMQTI